jgi:MFS superfamily sulfate permease-like transporter
MWEHLRRPVFTRLSPPGTVLTRFALPDQLTFLSKPGIAKALDAIPPGSRVELDGRHTTRFDVDALEIIHRFRATARERQIDYRLVGIPDAEPSASPTP